MKALPALALLAALAGVAGAARAADVGLIVPVFDGPDTLARNVSTTLNLQVWRTLRRAPYPNPRKLDFGSGIIRYHTDTLDTADPQAVARYAAATEVQLVMYGSVRALGDGVLVQAFVAAPPDVPGAGKSELWTLRDGGHSVSLDLPRRVFDFDPVVLDRALIEFYKSPNALRMCAAPRLPCDSMPVGSDWLARRQQGAWANIVANDSGRAGWLYLPYLDRMPNSISDLAAGLLSYYRGDFEQAARFFGKVAQRPAVQSTTRNDAAALALIARVRGGEDVGNAWERLADADPGSLYAFQAVIMTRLAKALASPDRRAALAGIAAAVERNRALFAADDRWLAGIDAITGTAR